METVPTGFNNGMTKTQMVWGLIYLPLHIFVFPILLTIAGSVIPGGVSNGTQNIIYYGAGLLFCLTFMLGFLRRSFDTLLDWLFPAILTMAFSIVVFFLLSYLVNVALLAIGGEAALTNPNDAAATTMMQGRERGAMIATSVFLAPIVEETLFRGALFGSMQKKSRLLAYAVSIALFGVYHVWTLSLSGLNWMLLAYIAQYIPMGYALTRCYEKSGSIWPPIFLHMLNNALLALTL